MTGPRRLDLTGLALVGLAAALWVARDEVAWALAARFRGVGFPPLSLLVFAAAGVLALTGLARLRSALRAALSRALSRLDAAEARLSTLPAARARALRSLGVSAVVTALGLALFEGTALGPALETRAFDLFSRLRFPERSQAELATGQALPSSRPQPDVVLVAIDDDSIARLGWPLPRVHYARLLERLSAAGASRVAFDVAFVDEAREHPEWDEALAVAARATPTAAFAFTVARLGAGPRPQLSQRALAVLDANALPPHPSGERLPDYGALVGGDVAPRPVFDALLDSGRPMAMTNLLLDVGDDVLRHSLVVAKVSGRLLPSLSLRLSAEALGVPLSAIRVEPGSHVDVGGKRRIPIDALGRTLVRAQGRHDTTGQGPFQYVPLHALLRADVTLTLAGNPLGEDQRFVLDEATRVTRDGQPVATADVEALVHEGVFLTGTARYSTDPGHVDTLALSTTALRPSEPDFELLDEHHLRFATLVTSARRSEVDLARFSGKQVLVGATALAAADLRTTPLGELPGVEHHATMLANILHDDFFTETPRGWGALLVFAAALLAALAGVSLPGEAALSATALLVVGWLSAAYALFVSGVRAPAVEPPLAALGSALLVLVLGARAARQARAKAEADREFVRQTFGRYLTEQVVQQLLDSPDGLALGGKRGFVTIMMTDLRGFTSMCGTMEPEAVVTLLNHYLEAMTRIIARHGGTIDEFIGDAILVVFGAPVPLERPELRAAACAIEMLNAMPAINAWNREHGLPAVEMGIGLHSGEVVLGNIGSALRAKYGIVGATINLTSRVESYTVGGQVLMSEATRERCGEALTLGASQVVSPKGVKGPLTIHEVLAVGAPFHVALEATAEALAPPARPLELRYTVIANKQVSGEELSGPVEALSERGLELRVARPLAALSDLALRLVDGGEVRPGVAYGKVLRAEVRPGVVYLRLTSVPADLRAVLDAAREAPPPAPPVAESALVPS
ncbi:MAG: adenylate/guanylate cyclase domain-containing protein [Myxococcaceae bacterium]|nr:adenylate/guanylate cyclase domain-containing protein [Myxococcaceae bacterium]MCA3016972.1 adenylate/guanylate cyclase domain-containing protein [Myxococcaceae bacterium]